MVASSGDQIPVQIIRPWASDMKIMRKEIDQRVPRLLGFGQSSRTTIIIMTSVTTLFAQPTATTIPINPVERRRPRQCVTRNSSSAWSGCRELKLRHSRCTRLCSLPKQASTCQVLLSHSLVVVAVVVVLTPATTCAVRRHRAGLNPFC